jgi:hypothetical protein
MGLWLNYLPAQLSTKGTVKVAQPHTVVACSLVQGRSLVVPSAQ